MPEIKLTRRGRRALKAGGLDGISAEVTLLMEIIKRSDGAWIWTTYPTFVDQLLERYGSHEQAIVAIKSGIVGLEKVE
jgi:hypothetical protein